MDVKKNIIFIINCIIGILIIRTPNIIAGHPYNDNLMGGLQIAEFIVRTIAFIIGLLVIHDAVKTYFK